MEKQRGRKHRIGEILAWFVLGLVALLVLGHVYPISGLAIGVALGIVAALGLLGRLKAFSIRTVRSLGLSVLSIFLFTGSSMELSIRYRLAQAQAKSPVAYLSAVLEYRGETAWRRALEQIDPDAYVELLASEAEQRALHEAQSEIERERRLQQIRETEDLRRAEQQALETENYLRNLARNLRDFEGPDTFQFATPDDILYFLDYVDGMGEFVARGRTLAFPPIELDNLDELEARLASLQRTKFPEARDAYGPIQRGANWRNFYVREIEMRTLGSGFRTIRFQGDYYLLNANRLDDFEAIAPDLRRMRFTDAEFLAQMNGEGTRWSLPGIPTDDAVGYWHNESFFRMANPE